MLSRLRHAKKKKRNLKKEQHSNQNMININILKNKAKYMGIHSQDPWHLWPFYKCWRWKGMDSETLSRIQRERTRKQRAWWPLKDLLMSGFWKMSDVSLGSWDRYHGLFVLIKAVENLFPNWMPQIVRVKIYNWQKVFWSEVYVQRSSE